MADYLPEDVLVRIFARLNVRSLICCSCVSKRWHSIVSSPQLAKSHYQVACEQRTLNHRLLVSTASQLESLELEETASFQVRKLVSPFKQLEREGRLQLLGSCNGLVCIAQSCTTTTFHIWNPSTGWSQKLPDPGFFKRQGPAGGCLLNFIYSGFGYLAAADDYKVVVSTESAADNHQLQFEIFSVKEQGWKRIQPPFRRWGLQFGGLLCNEALHWFDDLHEPAIMALDLAKNEFRTMLLPSFSNTMHLYMCASGGYLHMLRCKAVNKSSFHYVDWHNIELWILREYDDPASWIKLFTFQVSNKHEYIWRLRPVLVMENSTVVAKLIQKLTTLKFQLLRIGHKKGKPVIEQNNVYDLTSHMIEYEETLLRINDGVGVEPKAKRLITQHNASASRNAEE